MPNPSRDRSVPWPSVTPAPTPAPSTSSPKHKRSRDRRSPFNPVGVPSVSLDIRQDPGDDIPDQPAIASAMNTCQVLSGNFVLSCFPTSDTSISQHQFASFVWNSNLPQYAQMNAVNIYLFSATSQTALLSWLNVQNPFGEAGLKVTQVNDTWFGDRGSLWNGTDVPFLFYWFISPNTVTLDEAEASIPSQPIFTAVQTTFADSVVASMSASSASAASASSASALSASLASASSASAAAGGGHVSGGLGNSGSTSTGTGSSASSSSGAGANGSGGGTGNVQSNSSVPFPHWAIAVIVVLGFLALLAGGILAFFIMRRMRRRRNSRLSHRGSMGSSTPMMANAQEPQSPLVASAFPVPTHRPPSPDVHDGASTMSHGSESAPIFSGADAAVMADAFRAALRKPNFTGRPMEEGESPDSDPTNGGNHREPGVLLDRELAEEGRDIRSVGSSRGVRVETLSDADTVQDHLQ